MKLVFYSDQIIKANERIDRRLFENEVNGNLSIGYIPSGGDPDRKYFQAQQSYYRKYRVKDFSFLDLDRDFDSCEVGSFVSSDIIHLSGGDPIYFLKNLKKHQFLTLLKEYAHDGGTLVGVSGGGVLLGQTAGLFQLFQSDLETALRDRKNLTSLGLVDFEFLPHYNRWDEAFIKLVKRYTLETGVKVLACEDGDGIIVENEQIELIGSIIEIKDGTETILI